MVCLIGTVAFIDIYPRSMIVFCFCEVFRMKNNGIVRILFVFHFPKKHALNMKTGAK